MWLAGDTGSGEYHQNKAAHCVQGKRDSHGWHNTPYQARKEEGWQVMPLMQACRQWADVSCVRLTVETFFVEEFMLHGCSGF